MRDSARATLAAFLFALAGLARADPPIDIGRAAGEIRVDGMLGDPGWAQARRIDSWYETNPGDNVPPRVRNTAWLAYDDRFFYAAFEFEDPEPGAIRAPIGDRDNVPSFTDYGGVILDTRNDRRTGLLLLANPRGVQYDAVTDDASGNEDSSLDLFWDSAARVTASGWVLEIRVPFSSLRYGKADPQEWGVLLYRNWPRDYRYQMFSSRLPRGSNCFICNSRPLVGLRGLPSSSHYVIAPYASASRSAESGDGEGGLDYGPVEGDGGADLKWLPTASTAIDATLNPDFSQVEADVAQIDANERFALFYPEKRPFFLEGLELFSTPVQAVYTRSITSPGWGGRSTGKLGATAYTLLVADDRGGGTVILPGPNGSDTAAQDFESIAAVLRVRRDIGRSFVSFVATDREIDGGGHNRVFGPDGQWRPSDQVTVTGQFLLSRTENPERPDLSPEFDGSSASSHAAQVWASRSSRTVDLFAEYRDFGGDFRADLGFVPQAGYREAFLEGGYTFRPEGFFRRVRTFAYADHSEERDGDLIQRLVSAGVGFDARWSSFGRLRFQDDRIRSGDVVLPRRQLYYTYRLSPGRVFQSLEVDGVVGDQVDFDNSRPGTGGTVAVEGVVRPLDQLELRLLGERSWLDVRPEEDGDKERLFTAGIARLRTTYAFSPRSFVRAIAQYVDTRSDPDLYLEDPPPARSGGLASSLLFAYKINWQTVLYIGWGDDQALEEDGDLDPASRELFVKVSYAFQR